MRLHIHHKTAYSYEHYVAHSTQYLRLTPSDSSRQKVLSWDLRLPTLASRSRDAYGNILHVITVDFPHQDIVIEAEGYVEVDDCAREPADNLSPLIFLRSTPLTVADPALTTFALPLAALAKDFPEKAAWQLLEKLRAHMTFQSGETDVCTTAAEAFIKRQGVCQDFAHVYLACAHSLGIPARYVSGYLYTAQAEHVASHAWVEVWMDDYWWGLDVANGVEASHQHLKLAIGMDYLEACPVRGMRSGGGSETMQANARVHVMDQ
jgi:transglutaminase-like putative cysteine protease